MRKTVFLSICFGISFFLAGQAPQVSGLITDKRSGESIQGAIINDSGRFDYTYSNRNGFYSLGLAGGKYTLLVSAPGYFQETFHMDVYSSINLNVELKPLTAMQEDNRSNEVTGVNDYRSGHNAPLNSQVQNMPAILNESDPIKFLQFLPGVGGGIEGLSGLYARGGSADQNLITMDGLPIYGNGHIFGFLSGFNPDQVRDIQFYRGVMPARYGGRSGSALDISMLEGNKKDWKGNFWFDPLALRINANGPLNEKGTTTATFGIRRSWLDLLLPRNGDKYVFYNIHDLNAKVVFRPNDRNKISFWIYNGRDKYALKSTDTRPPDSLNRIVTIKIEYSTLWQNTVTGINFSHKISNRHYANFIAGMSRYTYKSDIALEGTVSNDSGGIDYAKIQFLQDNAITDFIGKADFEYNVNSDNYLRYGAEIIRHGFKPQIQSFKVEDGTTVVDSIYGKSNVQGALETSLYGEWEKNLGAGLKVNAGGRIWTFVGKDKTFIRPEPRIFISQILKDRKALKFGFSLANQGVQQLASVNAAVPSDIWFPSSKLFRNQQVMQITGGFYRPLKHGLEFTGDVYYKSMNGISDINGADEGDLLKNYWIKMLSQGKGRAYGFEAMVMKKHGRINGLASYTLAWSNRTIADINFGTKFPFRWDRRHKFALQAVYNVSEYFKFNFAMVLMTGNAVSVPTGKYVAADGTFVFDYSDKNNFRMPWYRRIDVGFSKEIHPGGPNITRQYWGINVYNMLNSYNPLFISIRKNDKGVLTAFGVSYFPFVPSAFYKWEF